MGAGAGRVEECLHPRSLSSARGQGLGGSPPGSSTAGGSGFRGGLRILLSRPPHTPGGGQGLGQGQAGVIGGVGGVEWGSNSPLPPPSPSVRKQYINISVHPSDSIEMAKPRLC